MSICYAELKKNSEALTAVNEAIKLDGNYFKAKLKRVHLLIENEKYDDAVREAESLYRTNKDQSVRALLDKAKTELKRSKQKDYYKILGVARNATEDDIKKAYKKKALLHHPDRHSNATPEEKKEHEIKFKELGEAYAILSDKNKKMRYDNGHDIEDILSGSAGRQTTADFGFDPNEIFASFFGGGANFAHPFNFNPHGGGGTFQSQNQHFGSGRNNPFGF
jgi:DnaJ family protein C protein 7